MTRRDTEAPAMDQVAQHLQQHGEKKKVLLSAIYMDQYLSF